MAERPDIRLCIDRIIPYHRKPEAAEAAIKENPGNRPRLPRLMAGASAHPAKIALFTGKKWQVGRVLHVAFLDGSKAQRAGVEKHAVAWSKYANIRFDFNGGSK